MRSYHVFVSGIPPDGNPGDVTTANWDDVHVTGAVVTPYTANGVVPTSVDYVRASGTIALTLTPGSQTFTGPSGSYTVNQVYRVKNTGSGVITITSLNGETFGSAAAASYELTQPGQWAEFVWNGTSWDVFGGMES